MVGLVTHILVSARLKIQLHCQKISPGRLREGNFLMCGEQHMLSTGMELDCAEKERNAYLISVVELMFSLVVWLIL